MSAPVPPLRLQRLGVTPNPRNSRPSQPRQAVASPSCAAPAPRPVPTPAFAVAASSRRPSCRSQRAPAAPARAPAGGSSSKTHAPPAVVDGIAPRAGDPSKRRGGGGTVWKTGATAAGVVTPKNRTLYDSHMRSHHRRIASAKSTLDTSLPKSMTLRRADEKARRRRGRPASSGTSATSSRRSSVAASTTSDRGSYRTNPGIRVATAPTEGPRTPSPTPSQTTQAVARSPWANLDAGGLSGGDLMSRPIRLQSVARPPAASLFDEVSEPPDSPARGAPSSPPQPTASPAPPRGTEGLTGTPTSSGSWRSGLRIYKPGSEPSGRTASPPRLDGHATWRRTAKVGLAANRLIHLKDGAQLAHTPQTRRPSRRERGRRSEPDSQMAELELYGSVLSDAVLHDIHSERALRRVFERHARQYSDRLGPDRLDALLQRVLVEAGAAQTPGGTEVVSPAVVVQAAHRRVEAVHGGAETDDHAARDSSANHVVETIPAPEPQSPNDDAGSDLPPDVAWVTALPEPTQASEPGDPSDSSDPSEFLPDAAGVESEEEEEEREEAPATEEELTQEGSAGEEPLERTAAETEPRQDEGPEAEEPNEEDESLDHAPSDAALEGVGEEQDQQKQQESLDNPPVDGAGEEETEPAPDDGAAANAAAPLDATPPQAEGDALPADLPPTTAPPPEEPNRSTRQHPDTALGSNEPEVRAAATTEQESPDPEPPEPPHPAEEPPTSEDSSTVADCALSQMHDKLDQPPRQAEADPGPASPHAPASEPDSTVPSRNDHGTAPQAQAQAQPNNGGGNGRYSSEEFGTDTDSATIVTDSEQGSAGATTGDDDGDDAGAAEAAAGGDNPSHAARPAPGNSAARVEAAAPPPGPEAASSRYASTSGSATGSGSGSGSETDSDTSSDAASVWDELSSLRRHLAVSK